MRYHFELVDVELLHAHEAVDEAALAEFQAALENKGLLIEPIIVDDRHKVILDGHHRYEALRRLGCARVPAYLIDYDDPDIVVTTWPEATVRSISKEDIIRMGLSEDVYPPKTSRHILNCRLEGHSVSLESLL